MDTQDPARLYATFATRLAAALAVKLAVADSADPVAAEVRDAFKGLSMGLSLGGNEGEAETVTEIGKLLGLPPITFDQAVEEARIR